MGWMLAGAGAGATSGASAAGGQAYTAGSNYAASSGGGGWAQIAGAVISGVGSYAQGKAAASAARDSLRMQAASTREGIQLQYQSEDWNRVQRIYEMQQGLQNYGQFSTLDYYAPDYENKVRYNTAVATVPRPY